jgi:uncharacterized protein (TIGR02001 family)
MYRSKIPLLARAAAVPLLLAVSAGIGLLVTGANADAATISGTAALTSDYVWRGTTQTQGDPAMQAGFKFTDGSGWYLSIWGSNVEFAPETHASSERDFSAGWAHSVSDEWAVDFNVLAYRYPSTTVDLNWTELNGTVTYAGNYWLSVGYSPEVFGSNETGIYTLLGAKFPLSDSFRIEAAAGYYFLHDLNGDGHDDRYAHALLSAVWAFKAPFEARLTAHATDSNAEDFFGDDFAGTRVEAALQVSY